MSVALPIAPAWMQDKGYSARDDRAVIEALGSGVIKGFDVSPGAGLSVNVQPGLAIVPGTRNAAQGSYVQRNGSVANVPWPAAGVSQRVDQLYVQIKDNTEIVAAGGLAGADEISVLNVAQQGSAVPADALVLATVIIPASASSILTSNITMMRPGRPGIRYGPAAPFVVASGNTWVNVPLNASDEPVGTWLGSVASAARTVPGVAGYYSYLAVASQAVGAAPVWNIGVVRKPSGAPIGPSTTGGTQVIAVTGYTVGHLQASLSGVIYLGATDGLEIIVLSDIGMTLSLPTDTNPTALWITKVAP